MRIADVSVPSFRRVVFSLGLVVLSFSCVGCVGGSGDLSTGSVSGKVTRNGQPVSSGSVMFSPVSSADKKQPGKPGAGDVGTDGSYTLTTYRQGDGAVIGKHRVTYAPPALELDEAQHKEDSPPPKNPFEGFIPKTQEVEVKSGSNTIDIELVPGPAGT